MTAEATEGHLRPPETGFEAVSPSMTQKIDAGAYA